MWSLIRQRLTTPSATEPLEELFSHVAGEEPDPLLVQWKQNIRRGPFYGSLHVRHVDTGSCNACEWELTALLNPVYDAQRLGIDFVASPRHADVLVVTGGVTRNLAQALELTYEATPAPKAVLAIGACACGTGLLGATYAQRGTALDSGIPVLVTVAGCPPSPPEILRGLLNIMTILNGGAATHGHATAAI